MYGTNSYTGGTVVAGANLSVAFETTIGEVPSSFVANNITLNGGELANDLNSGTNISFSANRGVAMGPNGGYLRSGFSNITTVNGVISNSTSGGGPLTIANDTGAVYLANTANTYTGSTTIGTPQVGGFLDNTSSNTSLNPNQGDPVANLSVAHLANGGQNSSIGASTNSAANLVFNSGSGGSATLNYVGAGDSTDRLFTIQSGGASINSSGAGPLNFTNTGSIVVNSATPSTLVLGGTYSGTTPNTFAPQIVDSSVAGNPTTLQINGSLWNLTTGTNNAYSGGTVLAGGTLLLTNAQMLQNGTTTVYAGKLAFASGVTSPVLGGLSGNGSIALADTASNPATLTVAPTTSAAPSAAA